MYKATVLMRDGKKTTYENKMLEHLEVELVREVGKHKGEIIDFGISKDEVAVKTALTYEYAAYLIAFYEKMATEGLNED